MTFVSRAVGLVTIEGWAKHRLHLVVLLRREGLFKMYFHLAEEPAVGL